MRIFTKRAEIAVRTRCLRRIGGLRGFARRVLDIGAHVVRRDELGNDAVKLEEGESFSTA